MQCIGLESARRMWPVARHERARVATPNACVERRITICTRAVTRKKTEQRSRVIAGPYPVDMRDAASGDAPSRLLLP